MQHINSKKKIGFTTSFPVEIVYAAGFQPVDLNNIFITNNPYQRVQDAEYQGFPRNVCSWIKGLYSTATDSFTQTAGESGMREILDLRAVVGVVQGDCSNTHSLMSLFQDMNIEVIPFSFPYNKEREFLKNEIERLKEYFQVTDDQVTDVKRELDTIRCILRELDRLTWQDNKVTGLENHYWLVNSSDFAGDPNKFKANLEQFVTEAAEREPFPDMIRLGYIGVPPIFLDLYDVLLSSGANVVFNEVQRQFAMPFSGDEIVDQYLNFTYPYSVYDRIRDIKTEAIKRGLQGLISYSQAFCHRQIDNILLKKHLPFPIIMLEGDQPVMVDERTKLRIESFLDILRIRRT